MKRLQIRPTTFRAAADFVGSFHRHHGEPQGAKFAISALEGRRVAGYAIVGRPVARMLDDGVTAEVTRLCTDGTPNACSALYGAAARIAREMGYAKIITYILETEDGTSLRAAGWRFESHSGGGSWSRPSRGRNDKAPTIPKQRWSMILRPHLLRRMADHEALI